MRSERQPSLVDDPHVKAGACKRAAGAVAPTDAEHRSARAEQRSCGTRGARPVCKVVFVAGLEHDEPRVLRPWAKQLASGAQLLLRDRADGEIELRCVDAARGAADLLR